MAFIAKEPVAIETQWLQAKSDPTQSKQLTTICSDWVGSFKLAEMVGFEPTGGCKPPPVFKTDAINHSSAQSQHIFEGFFIKLKGTVFLFFQPQ